MSNPQPDDRKKIAVLVAALAAEATGLYLAAEVALIATIGGLVAKYGFGDLLHYRMRKSAQATAAKLNADAVPLVEKLLEEASLEGFAAGTRAVPDATPPVGRLPHGEVAAQAIRDDLVSKLQGLSQRITRFPDDVYKTITPDAAISQVADHVTSEAAQQAAYSRLMGQGITGFVDKAGRQWSLSAYVEMAVRTSAQRAYNASHLSRMTELGVNYFTVSDDGAPCPLCAPWENVVLSNGTDEEGIAAASVDDATAAGLFHPNCKHVLVAFFPGVSEQKPNEGWSAADQKAYAESQQQRAIERDIRAAKRELEGAYTPDMKAAANRKIRAQQARMRAFLDQTGRVRRSRREQLNLGNK